MKFGLVTDWDSKNESIDQWLKREREAKKLVENPTCPYCLSIHEEWYEFLGLQDFEVDDYEIQCHDCNKKFLVNKNTQVRFESKKIEPGPEPVGEKE